MTREDPSHHEAHREMTPGSVGAVTSWVLILGTVLLLLAVPVRRQLETGHGTLLAKLRSDSVDASGSGLLDRLLDRHRAVLESIDRFESRFEDSSPVRRAALPWFQWLLFRFGGVGNETVYSAPRDWLYLRSGYDHTVGPPFLDPRVLERRRRAWPSWKPPLQPDPRPALLDFHRQLEQRGIQLLFLPIPSKAGVAADRPGARNPSMETLLGQLEAAGVQVFDPHPLLLELGDDAFLRTDSHWSPAAVAAVAEELTARIDQVVDLPTYRDFTRTDLPRRALGDLARQLKPPPGRMLFAEEETVTAEVATWDGLLWSPEHGAPVLLLGDSFSTVFSDEALHWGTGSGLAEQIAYFSGRGVDRIARNDGSSDQVRRDLARQPERLEDTRVVIYQVAARELSVGDWPLVNLPEGSRR